jgi:riboflavin kinase/FMN adenylyltransferase
VDVGKAVQSMQVVGGWDGLDETLRNATVALGNFDGVHRGHAHLLRTAHAARPGSPLAVLTFEPHPREFFRPDDPPFRLTLAAERAAALAALGIQVLYELPFDAALSNLGAHAFIEQVLHRGVGAAHLACGADFAFGHRRGGDVTFLADRVQALGIGLTIVPKLSDAQGPISSTRIRRLLQDGYPERAAEELGRPWAIRGVVSHGDKRGRTIGFPTANVPLGRHLEPCRGVYAVRATLPDGTEVPGVANIGRRPTVNEGPESRVEAHLFDWQGDIYGQEIGVALHGFLRTERKFGSFPELKTQIELDAELARAMLEGEEI